MMRPLFFIIPWSIKTPFGVGRRSVPKLNSKSPVYKRNTVSTEEQKMKFILSLFLMSICVAVSHCQQYRQQILMLRPWMSQFYQPSNTFDDYPPRIRQGIYGDSRVNPIFNNGNDDQKDQVGHQYASNGFVQPRIKNFEDEPSFLSNQDQMDKRNFFNYNNRNNPLISKAATFTITSTCTSIAYSSCVPRANLLPDAPAAVPNCRRKRQLFGEDDDKSQFPIIPTQVDLVSPTVLTSSTIRNMKDDTREIATVVSSKDDDNESAHFVELMKVKRFLYWPNYISSTTTTTWSVVSTILTRTFVPGVNLDCLPPGYVVCPQAG